MSWNVWKRKSEMCEPSTVKEGRPFKHKDNLVSSLYQARTKESLYRFIRSMRITVRAAVFVGIIALGLITIVGSNGGGGGGSSTADDTSNPPSPDSATISAALTSVQSELDALFDSDTEPSLEEIVDAIQTVPDIYIISSTPDDNGVVATIGEDGPMLFIALPHPAGYYDPEQDTVSLTDMDLESAHTLRSDSSLDELPEKTNVLLLNGLGGNTYKDITPDIRKIFTNYYDNPNYTVTRKDATIENLRAVKDVDVLFIKSHGVRNCAVTPYDDPNVEKLATYAISSSTRVDLSNPSPSAYNADINKHNIVFIYAATDKEGLIFKSYKKEWLYGITWGFIHDYWRFNPGGLVFICCCSSASPEATTFLLTVFEQGPSVYIGWTAPVDTDFADVRAQYVFDRLVGANSYSKPTPEQRAFTYPDIQEEMQSKNMLTWAGDGDKYGPSTLKFQGNPADDRFGLLAPSIKYMEIDEKINSSETPVLSIFGTFGDVEGQVYLDSEELTIKSWSASEIKCELAPDDAGDIVVEVNDIKSNKRRITKWEGTVTFTAVAPHPNAYYPPQISCNLKDRVVWDLKFRADIATYRTKPGKKPIDRIIKFQPTKKSKTTFSSSGSQVVKTDDGPLTLWVWSGSGNLGVNKVDDSNISHFYGEIDTAQKLLKMDIMFMGLVGSKIDSYCPGTPAAKSINSQITLTNPVISGLFDEINIFSAQYIVYIPLDDSWGIQKDKREEPDVEWDTIGNVKATLEWDAMPADNPPVEDKEHGR